MNKTVLGVIIAVVAIGGIAAAVITSNTEEPTNTTTSQSDTTDHSEMTASNGSEQTTGQQPAGETASTSSVTIQDFAFSPATTTVKAGTKVTWTNQDRDRHDITPDDETSEFKQSDLLSRGESYSVTFTKAGTYTYYCSPHPYMKGTIVVTD